jgi:hypothetical protein
MDRIHYEKCIAMLCDLLSPNFSVITKQKVCQVFNIMRTTPLDVPGYWMNDAMEKWGKQNNYQFVFSVNKQNKRKNVMLVKV